MAQLKKVLSFPVILLITINAIMGTGIFFLPALGAKTYGPASILAWLILSIISIYIGMCFAELSSMFPKSGGIYEFCKQAYGRFFSFFIGWMTVLAGNITIAMLVVGAIQYLLPLGSTLTKILISLIFVLIFNYIAFRGMKTSAFMLVTFSIITLGTLLALIIPGFLKLQPTNFTPFFIFPTSALLITIFLIAETFFGWETATFLAEETKNPRKIMPKALIWGTIIIAVICVLFVVSSLGSISWKIFGQSAAPLTDLGILHYGLPGGNIFTILVYLAIIGSVAGWVVSAPRLLLAMAKDKLFLTQFSRVHSKYFTPHRAIIFQTILTTILVIVGAGSYTTILHLLVPIVLLAYTFVLLTIPVLRRKHPTQQRAFKVPFGTVGPIIVSFFMLSLIVMWLFYVPGALNISKVALSLLFLGLPLYFLIEMYYDAPVILKVNEYLSYFSLLFENIFFPVSLRKKTLTLLGNIKNKKVIEFGCSVGTITRRLAHRVLPRGKIYAIDPIKHNLKITKLHTRHHRHITFIHHPFLHHFKPTSLNLKNADAIISTGILSYLQKPQLVLSHLSKRCRSGARIVFIEYDNFFYFIPNTPWLEDDHYIKTIFTKAGFKITIERKQSLFWQYIFIVGEKK